MKVYYFVIISIGLMLLFPLAGVQTGSSKIVNFIQAGVNQNATINPTVEVTDLLGLQNAGTFWIAFAIAIGLFGASLIKLVPGLGQYQSPMDAIMAILSSVIFAIVALDFYSIYTFVRELTGAIGWEFNLIRIIIFVYLGGFAISIIQFIRGSD